MALPWDKRDFASWREALVQHRLTDKQIDLLEGMVQEGAGRKRPGSRRDAGLAGKRCRPR